MRTEVYWLFPLVMALPWMVGCPSRKGPTVTATGNVTVDGKPLSGAVATFEPMRNTTGPNVSVPVFDGKFVVPANAGLHGGAYRVRIAMIPAEIRREIPAQQSQALPPDEAMIAPSFDGNSTLECELQPGQTHSLSFEVEFLK